MKYETSQCRDAAAGPVLPSFTHRVESQVLSPPKRIKFTRPENSLQPGLPPWCIRPGRLGFHRLSSSAFVPPSASPSLSSVNWKDKGVSWRSDVFWRPGLILGGRECWWPISCWDHTGKRWILGGQPGCEPNFIIIFVVSLTGKCELSYFEKSDVHQGTHQLFSAGIKSISE